MVKGEKIDGKLRKAMPVFAGGEAKKRSGDLILLVRVTSTAMLLGGKSDSKSP
ncbi:MAG: hypothetical protein GF344_17020 [Chitinivibrionales bacterium]|nr:hypothetical protein [Chitinivibrionales bacterium]